MPGNLFPSGINMLLVERLKTELAPQKKTKVDIAEGRNLSILILLMLILAQGVALRTLQGGPTEVSAFRRGCA